jgi:hypothetical protein
VSDLNSTHLETVGQPPGMHDKTQEIFSTLPSYWPQCQEYSQRCHPIGHSVRNILNAAILLTTVSGIFSTLPSYWPQC